MVRPSRLVRDVVCGLVFAIFWMMPAGGWAQGCTQCRDNTVATSPATQRAFRHSIEFMVVAASGFFGLTALVIRRTR